MSARNWQDGFFRAEEDDGRYQAWRTCQQGSVMNLRIIPAPGTGQPERFIPYLQPITIEWHAETSQLALICHSTGMLIFLEGQGLGELAELIAEKRVKSIHAYDYNTQPEWQKNGPYISKITVEQR